MIIKWVNFKIIKIGEAFYNYLKMEQSSHNFDFLLKARHLKGLFEDEEKEEALKLSEELINKYIDTNQDFSLNLSGNLIYNNISLGKTRINFFKNLKENDSLKERVNNIGDIYNIVKSEIYNDPFVSNLFN
jgi:hypothetical protein